MTRPASISIVLVLFLLALTVSPVASVGASSTATTFVFAGATKPAWVVVNDGVMGGVSSSKVADTSGVLRWSGRVRLENKGGFASVRSPSLTKTTNAAMAAGTSIRLRLRGSTTAFNVTLQTAGEWFWAELTPSPKQSSTVVIPYARFLPRTRFGEPLSGAPYAGQPLVNIGVIISNGRAEAFRLDIDALAVE